jgi:hypothetical protein
LFAVLRRFRNWQSSLPLLASIQFGVPAVLFAGVNAFRDPGDFCGLPDRPLPGGIARDAFPIPSPRSRC